MITAFATFGSDHLPNFHINSMKVILVAEDESELRQRLQEEPFNNHYCTTYPISQSQDMQDKYGMVEITLDELLRLEI